MGLYDKHFMKNTQGATYDFNTVGIVKLCECYIYDINWADRRYAAVLQVYYSFKDTSEGMWLIYGNDVYWDVQLFVLPFHSISITGHEFKPILPQLCPSNACKQH